MSLVKELRTSLGLLFPKEIIDLVASDTLNEEYEAFDERYEEITTGRLNSDRMNNNFYPAIRKYIQATDEAFLRHAPKKYQSTAKSFELLEKRWERAIDYAGKFRSELHLGTPSEGGIIDCRAKSIFSIWEKMTNFHLDTDEVFDQVALRITVKNKESARKIAETIVSNHTLIQPHKFRHTGEIHQPSIDTLDDPNKTGFAQIRLNIQDEGMPLSYRNPDTNI